MRASRSIISIITSICVAWVTVAPSRVLADPPDNVSPTTVLASASIAASPFIASAPAPAEVPNVDGGSLEAVASLQRRFQEFYDFPELFMTIAAASMTVLALAELWKFIKEDAPAYWAARKALRKTDAAYALAMVFDQEFRSYVHKYTEATRQYHSVATDLEKRRRRLMKEIDPEKAGVEPEFRRALYRLRREIGTLSSAEQMQKLSHDQGIRRALRQSDSGLKFLERWDSNYADYRKAKAGVLRSFRPIQHIVAQFSDALEEASTGLIRNPELRIAPLQVRVRAPHANESSEIETLIHTNNGGGSEELHDARKLPRKLEMTRRDCDTILARLANVRDNHRNRMTVAKWKLGIFSAGTVTAAGGYYFGNVKFKERHNADPLQIVQEKKKEQAVQDARLAAEATSPASMADTLKTWQKEEVPGRIMKAMRAAFKSDVIPKFADDIRRIGRGKLDQEMEARLKEIESTPELVDTIVRNSLADALSEYKIADLKRMEKALLADASDPMQSDAKELREQVIAFAVAASPKHIWPNLVARPNMYPIDVTTTMPSLVDSVRTALEDVRKAMVAEAAARDTKSKAQSTNSAPLAKPQADTTSAAQPAIDATKAGAGIDPATPTATTSSLSPASDKLGDSIVSSPVLPVVLPASVGGPLGE